jgi:mannosyltransferase
MRSRSATVVAVPAVLAAILCLIELTSRSLGFDEAASVTIAAQHGGALGSAIAHDGGNQAGYYVLLHVLISIFGNGTLAIRLPSVIATVATVGVTAALAQRLFGQRVAFASGLLTAVSLPLVFWGQDARGYAPMVALIAASYLALVCLVEAGGRSRGAWIAYFVTTTLAAYFGFLAVLVIPAQLIALWWRRDALRPVLIALAAAVVCWIPLVVLALRRGAGQLFWVPHPSAQVLKQVLEALTSSGLQPSFHARWMLWPLLIATVAVVLVVAVVHVRQASQRTLAPRPELWGQALVLLWLFVPFGLALLESLVATPVFIPRNLLICLPAVAILIAVGLGDPRLSPVVSWGAVAAVIALRALALGPSYGVSPEPWHQASNYVLTRATPRDCIAFYPLDARMAFRYYVSGAHAAVRAPRSVLPELPWSTVKPQVEDFAGLSVARLSAVRATCPRLWLVSSHEGQADGPSARSRANWARFVALRGALERAYGTHALAQFGYAATIHVERLGG